MVPFATRTPFSLWAYHVLGHGNRCEPDQRAAATHRSMNASRWQNFVENHPRLRSSSQQISDMSGLKKPRKVFSLWAPVFCSLAVASLSVRSFRATSHVPTGSLLDNRRVSAVVRPFVAFRCPDPIAGAWALFEKRLQSSPRYIPPAAVSTLVFSEAARYAGVAVCCSRKHDWRSD